MALLNQGISLEELPASSGFDPIPAGEYTAKVVSAELRNTKAGTGQGINVRLDVTGPTNQGRCLWYWINIKNPNPEAEEIGLRQLGDLMRAIGLSRVTDTDQLVGSDVLLVVDIKVGKDENGEDKLPENKIKGIKAIGNALPTSAPAVPTASAPTTGATPPWAKK